MHGPAVLLHTGWDRWFGMPEHGLGAPFLTGDGAEWLIDAGAVLVGIDSVNGDDIEPGGARGRLLTVPANVVELSRCPRVEPPNRG